MKIAIEDVITTEESYDLRGDSYYLMLREYCWKRGKGGFLDTLFSIDPLEDMIYYWDSEGILDWDFPDEEGLMTYQKYFGYKRGTNLVFHMGTYNDKYEFYKVDKSVLKSTEHMSKWIIENVISKRVKSFKIENPKTYEDLDNEKKSFKLDKAISDLCDALNNPFIEDVDSKENLEKELRKLVEKFVGKEVVAKLN